MGEVKRELGPAATMGDAMAAISTKWKSMGKEEQQIYMEKENKDRKRFQRESVDADAKAIAIQQERRDNLVAQKNKDVSKRGARMKVATEERLSEMDSDELKERQRRKALKKAQTAERQRKRDKEEKALKDCHKKMHKAEAGKAASRLKYLLKQSSIFSKL